MRDKSLRSGERQVAVDLNGIEAWHRWRYNETLGYIEGKSVLDMCCGTGYGSFIMSDRAKSVVGVDDSPEAIEWANEHFKRPNNSFVCSDFLDFNTKGIDTIVTFEAIEHIKDSEAVFAKFKAINPETIILSCPHLTCPIGANKFHHRHYGLDELVNLFIGIGYKINRAELKWFGKSLCNFIVVNK